MATQGAVHEKGFTVLYEASHPRIDVVFVHGFTGHPKDTWTLKKTKEQPTKRAKKHGRDDEPETARSKLRRLTFHRSATTPSTATPSIRPSRDTQSTDDIGDGNMAKPEGQHKDIYWPEDLACITLPDSRILTYGYDTKIRHRIQGPVSRKTVIDHAGDFLYSLEALRRNPNERGRPILFVAHSLGGIVVKEALRQSRGCASAKPHIHGIFDATAGLLFFGTPHRGADPRNFFHHVLAASGQALGFQVNAQIVDTLMPHAEQLSKLRNEFSAMCHERKWKVFSFQEEYGVTVLFGKQVVDKESSCLDDPTVETKQHISNNHMDMCRFYGLQDPEYSKVAAAMTFILATTENGTQTTSDEQSVICSPPGDTAPPPETQEEHTKVGYSIDATVKQSLVEQLYFTKIDERLTGLTGAQGTTCRWFLAKPEYAAWQDVAQQSEHGGFLWIKGNPGTGKSTLMKFLFEEANHNRKSDPSRITLSFFFLARGTIEEKSTTGLYRSLLHQLFQKAVDLKDCLEWMTADGARGVEQNGWHEAALKQTLMHALPKLGSRSLTIFVDALDECDQSQAASMVNFFEELCDRATEAQVNLQICFSSRHYPTIIIQKGIEVTLEDEDGHIQDIQQYIKSNLRLGKSKQAEPLRSEILEKSSGIFLWVVLVLDILNAEYPNSLVSTKAIRNRLKEIPPGLHDLFEMILARDGDNLERLQMCLKWILFAARTLKPQELYFAIQLGLDKESSTCWDQEDVELDGLKTFVRSSSKGLAEVTRNKASEVQFIHQSVRDFLLGRYGAQWSGVGSFEGNCHNMLRDCCLAQLNASISQEVEIPDTPLEQPRAAKELRRRVKLKFPLLEYSVLNVLHHANYAQQHGVEQKGFLASFPLPRWVLLNNTLEMYLIRRHTKTVSLLYILAERNLADLIRIHPQAMSCFDVGDERYGLPIFAALATDSYEAIESFLDVQPVIQTQGPLHDLCKRFCRDRGRRHLFNRSFTFPRERRLLSYIIEHDDERVLALFINAGLPNVEDLARHGVLSYAAQRGYRVVVAMLLTINGIDIELKDGTGRTPLCWAAHNGHDTIVRLLVEKDADVESKDDSGRTPLCWAAHNGHDTIVRLLLENDANINSKANYGRTPLSWATQQSNDTIVQLLLEKGADIESKDDDGRTPLLLATDTGNDTIVRLLLEKGADIESKDNSGRTPLLLAIQERHDTTIRLLLEKGADIESRDRDA